MGVVGCGSIEVGAEGVNSTGADGVEGKAIEVGIQPTPMPEKLTYTNDFYGFKFEYPETWTLTETDHGVVLMQGTNRLGINFRWVNEDFSFGRTGFGGGTPIYRDKINFLGQIIPQYVVELDQLAKYVIFSETILVEIDELAFAIVLEDLDTDYMVLDLPDEAIVDAKTILESFVRIETTGSPPEEVSIPETDDDPPVSTTVVAWLGHIASLPEGSQFDDMVLLSPEGMGEFGLKGTTPEIEVEIHVLRDAQGPNEFAHFWGVLSCGIEDYNNCQLSVDRLQYGPNFSEEEISDWFGTIRKSTFNQGESYVFELLSEFPMWYSINASQDEALRAQIDHYYQTGEVVEVSGKLMVGVPDVNGTRIEISSIEAQSPSGMPRPDNNYGSLYENRGYGFSFQYPTYMSVVEEPNKVLINHGALQLTIAYRRVDDNVQIADVGDLTGQFHPYTEVFFLGQPVQPSLNINDGYITGVYLGGPGVELGEGTPLRFVISLVSSDGERISNAQVDEMLQIFQNFALASWTD
jgi:hypothetical protein